MGVMNAGSVQLVSKPGSSGWAQLVSLPSWIQQTYPAVPDGASSITLRFKMDGRYRPQLYGGNPCPNASSTYNCSLCTTGAWDYSVPAGLHMLWSAAGRSSYVISFIEFDALAAAWDRGRAGDKNSFNVLVDSPTELALQSGEGGHIPCLQSVPIGIFDISFLLCLLYLLPATCSYCTP